MNEIFEIKIEPGKEDNISEIKNIVSEKYKISIEDLADLVILKRSLDARKSPVFHIKCTIEHEKNIISPIQNNVRNSPAVHIIGAGPAGLFAAIRLIELGLKPILLERGKDVRNRRKDLAALMKQGTLNPDSNYCFGEGGAGTFSDGKLYTRSNKRGSVQKVLETLVFFGANRSIMIDAHPHIGTNKLPVIINNISKSIIDCGGEIHFSTKVTDFQTKSSKLVSIDTSKGKMEVENLILATGHSARDIFYALHRANIAIEAKSFALGVRIEHPQEVINKIQYKNHYQSPALPPASYSLVTQANSSGVYTFCMCPGGIICPASTEDGEVVVNGWSPSTRGSYFANSGLVVEIKKETLKKNDNDGVFACLNFQAEIEKKAFEIGGGKFTAPAQRVEDFISSHASSTLPKTSYKRGISPSDLRDVLPKFVSSRLKLALIEFVKKNPLYGTKDAVLVGVESRTSSPIKIPRNEKGNHVEISGLYPCGEGAGYAGGIVSAAIDGMKIAEMIKANNSN